MTDRDGLSRARYARVQAAMAGRGVGATLGVSLEHGKHEVLYLVRPGKKRELRSLL